MQSAYQGTIEDGSFPLFVMQLSIDPAKVDVNVHPTKTEVKFEDERHIYNIIKAAVRKSLGMHIVQPDMDTLGLGGLDEFLNRALPTAPVWTQQPNLNQSTAPSYNPFKPDQRPSQIKQDWSKILGPVDNMANVGNYNPQKPLIKESEEIRLQECFLLRNRVVVAMINDELYLIDTAVAQEKVFYHQFCLRISEQKAPTQQLLFPRTLDINPSKLHLLLELIHEFKSLGFDLSHFGGNSVLISGLPPEVSRADEGALIEKMLEEFENTQGDLRNEKHDRLALVLARQAARQNSNTLDKQSIEMLIHSMFAMPDTWMPFRNKTVAVKMGIDLIQEIFRKGAYA